MPLTAISAKFKAFLSKASKDKMTNITGDKNLQNIYLYQFINR